MSDASAADETGIRPSRALIMRIFFAALTVRWIYALVLYVLMGDEGLKGVDSYTYAANALEFADALHAGTLDRWHLLGAYPVTMPLYLWISALPFWLFGNAGTIGYVLLQGAIDSMTCVLVYLIALPFGRRLALAAGIVAVVNPTQIVLSGLIYTDTPYTFFVALSLYAALRWSRSPNSYNAAWLGGALAGAALIRVSIAPWGVLAIGLLGGYGVWRRWPLWRPASLSLAIVVLGLGLGVIVARNVSLYGAWALTSQGGEHLALYIVPLAKEAQDRTPFMTTLDVMNARTTERFGAPSPNPFEQSRRYQTIGVEALRDEIRFTSLAKSWISGMLINLVSPAHLISPPVAQLPRTGFYGTPGNSIVEKVFNYAFHSGNATYSWLLLLGSLGVAAVRAVQLLGAWTLAKERRHWPKLIFALSWVGFLLVLDGPIASPKYRLPLEPLFNIMTGAGVLAIRSRRDISTTAQ